jgi:hypothetical protein
MFLQMGLDRKTDQLSDLPGEAMKLVAEADRHRFPALEASHEFGAQ